MATQQLTNVSMSRVHTLMFFFTSCGHLQDSESRLQKRKWQCKQNTLNEVIAYVFHSCNRLISFAAFLFNAWFAGSIAGWLACWLACLLRWLPDLFVCLLTWLAAARLAFWWFNLLASWVIFYLFFVGCVGLLASVATLTIGSATRGTPCQEQSFRCAQPIVSK